MSRIGTKRHRDLESLTSCDSLGALGRQHGPHLAAKFGRNLPVGECLLDCRSKLTLSPKRGIVLSLVTRSTWSD